MSLKPLSDRVVLKQLEAEETTKGGIILTTQAKEKPQEAEVVAVGPGAVYSKYAGTEVKNDDVEYVIVKESDILAIVE